jgi:hypothetical protein
MADTLTAIIPLIVAKISALKNGTAPIFVAVTDYATGEFTGFPAASVFETGGSGQVIDTHRNQRVFNFTIQLYQEQSVAGKSKAEATAIMRDAVDRVLATFDHDRNLGGQIDTMRVLDFDTNFRVAAGIFNFATIRAAAVVLVQSY